MIQLPQDFKEFLQLLSSKKIEYLVIGGYAVAFHGHPRATGDLDIWIALFESTLLNSRPEEAVSLRSLCR